MTRTHRAFAPAAAPLVGALLAAVSLSGALAACSTSGSGPSLALGVGPSTAPSSATAPSPTAAGRSGSAATSPVTARSATAANGSTKPTASAPRPTSSGGTAAGGTSRPTPSTGTSRGGTSSGGASAGSAATERTDAAQPDSAPAALLLAPGTESLAESEVVTLVNTTRTAAGCAPVTVDPTLVELARAHSLDMAGAGGFRHNGSDGRTPFQRMTAAGYDYSIAAENIAAGQPNASSAMDAWLTSPGYRQNIVDCRLTQLGVGVITRQGTPYVTYWTQDFAAPM